MNEANETLLDLEDLETLTLDDVEAAPDFLCPSSGAFIIGIAEASIQKKAKEGEPVKQSIRIIYFVGSTLELAKQEDDLVPDGTLFSENFQGTKDGLKYFKARMVKLLGQDTDGINLKDMLEFLPKQFGKDGEERLKVVLRKVISDEGFENVRFQKIEKVAAG